jgi:hypothetical protein
MDATIIDRSSHRIRFNVTPSTVLDNGIYVQLYKTNPINPVKNIRVIFSKE